MRQMIVAMIVAKKCKQFGFGELKLSLLKSFVEQIQKRNINGEIEEIKVNDVRAHSGRAPSDLLLRVLQSHGVLVHVICHHHHLQETKQISS